MEGILNESSGSLRPNWEQQKDAIFSLLLHRFCVCIFTYEVDSDSIFYMRALDNDLCVKKDRKEFYEFFLSKIDNSNGQKAAVAKAFNLSMRKVVRGTVEYRAKLVDEQYYHWYRTVYRSLADASGKVFAVVGYTEDIEDEVGRRNQMREEVDPLTQLYNAQATKRFVNDKMASLKVGEKGILFLLSIGQSPSSAKDFQLCMCAVAEILRADFRSEDILGRVGENLFAIFIHGGLSIDIIEKQAQRITDIFLRDRLPHEPRLMTVFCNIGISTACSRTMGYADLKARAEVALARSAEHGKNLYRLYDDERY